MISRPLFFDGYRQKFNERLSQDQVKALEYKLIKFDESSLFDRRSKIAYALGTIRRETANAYRAVREGYYLKKPYMETVNILYNYYLKNNRGAIKSIFPLGINRINYIGRGDVQITHWDNYNKHKKHIQNKYGVNILEDPEAIISNEDISFDIMELGMNAREYSFTGKILSDYFNDKTESLSLEKRFIGYRNLVGYLVTPRRIINVTDHYREIGSDSIKFYDIIEFA